MASKLSALGALASALVLAACTATGGNVKPAAQIVASSTIALRASNRESDCGGKCGSIRRGQLLYEHGYQPHRCSERCASGADAGSRGEGRPLSGGQSKIACAVDVDHRSRHRGRGIERAVNAGLGHLSARFTRPRGC